MLATKVVLESSSSRRKKAISAFYFLLSDFWNDPRQLGTCMAP
jgi:hypothetical protein